MRHLKLTEGGNLPKVLQKMKWSSQDLDICLGSRVSSCHLPTKAVPYLVSPQLLPRQFSSPEKAGVVGESPAKRRTGPALCCFGELCLFTSCSH